MPPPTTGDHSVPSGAPALSERLRYAHELARSGLLPRQYRGQPANVLVALDTGTMLGIAPMAALHHIHLIEGTPTLSAALLVALVRRAGHRFRVWGSDTQAIAELVRRDDPEFTYRVAWTPQDAVTAGLCHLRDGRPYARDSHGRSLPWEKYPAALLKARAASQACRDGAQDVFCGPVYVPEELGALVDVDGTPIADDTAMVQAIDQSETDWEIELRRLEGDYAGLQEFWRRARSHRLPAEFLNRIRALGEAAREKAEPVVVDHADPDHDPALCDGSRQPAEMTLEREGTTIGICPICTQWSTVDNDSHTLDHATTESGKSNRELCA